MATTAASRRYEKLNPILAEAHRLIDQAWLDTGVTSEELERDEVMSDVFEGLVAQGKTYRDAQDYLSQTSWEEMQRKHRELFPRRYASNGTS